MDPSDLHLRLARRVVGYARWHELAAGEHLVEQSLADTFEVSRSSARAALELLATRGVLEHRRHRGYFLAKNGRDLDPGWLEALTSQGEALYRRLVQDLLAGTLPETVTTTELQRRYDVSRALMSRVLAHMRGEGLIERREGHGWRFLAALTSSQAYDASYRFRLIIEPAALLEPTFSPDPECQAILTRMHRRLLDGAIESASYAHLYDVDAAFHEAVASWSGNGFIRHCVQQQNRLRRLTEYEYYADRGRMGEWVREHLAVLEAVDGGHLEHASRLLHDHIATSWRLRPSFPEPAPPSADNGGMGEDDPPARPAALPEH